MSEYKTEVKFFTVPQWREEEKYLRDQHKNGWEFVSLSGLGIYRFRRCEGQDVVYQLDYNPDSVNKKGEYIHLFADCGWEYLQNYAGYSYFRKPADQMDGEEEIFCDDESRLDMMKRVFRGRMLPLVVLFFTIIIPQLLNLSFNSSALGRGLLIFFELMFVVYLIIFIAFAVPYYRYYNSANRK